MMRRIGPWHGMSRLVVFCLMAMMVIASGRMLRAQDEQPFAGGQMVRGTVTTAASDHLSIKTDKGEAYQIAVTSNTRIMKDRQPVKITDIKPGDGVGAMGLLDAPTKTVHAVFVMVVDAEQARKLREGLGKVYIVGKVQAIDELKLTILRPDGIVQVIAVDESTSFRKGRPRQSMNGQASDSDASDSASNAESVTLADIKVGDNVAGKGALKNGVFVPSQLSVMDASQQRRRRPDGSATGSGSASDPQ
ncbi:hypothetical protein [Granulicella arctica]|uniref:DUF5666 domain-containing protein n=1 Tax=Granulicella arctica TaxID=940613 RepID=A0A7Y9PG53_9BACT|nr:hypothetical protein [Granulicella arctica]NYF79295.1 hypothetical protein [Granulicella arctica]